MSAVPSDLAWPRFPNGGLADKPFKNTSASTAYTPGQVVKLDTSNPYSPTAKVAGMVLTTAVTDLPDGVVVGDTPAGGYGTLQDEGWATVYQDASGNVAAGAVVGPSGTVNGAVVTYTGGDPAVGKALSAGTASADPILVRLILAPTQ